MENRLRIEEEDSDSKKGDEANKKLELLRVKLLRLALRLGIQNPNNNVIVSQVLQRLVLLPSSSDDDQQLQLKLELPGGRDHHPRAAAFSFDREQAIAAGQLADREEAGCTILVLGKTGVGKSATINSIFGEVKCATDAFQLCTKKVRDVVGTVGGIKLRIIDTPGLVSTCSWSDQRRNEKSLHSIKRFIRKTVPDIVIYVDRLDMPIKNDAFGDIPLLQTVNKILGSWLWFKAIVVLTHAESASPHSSSYDDTFVSQRSHAVQRAICEAVGNMRIMNPFVLAENHSRACRAWVPHLLLLSFASMILSEANTSGGGGGGDGNLLGPPPLVNFLLSSLISPIPQLYPKIQHQHDPNSDKEKATDYAYFDNSSDDDDGDGEYDELPPIKFLTKAEIAKLTKVEKKEYFDELKYRGKLLLKKEYSFKGKNFIEVPADGVDSDLTISFDSQQPTYLFRFPTNSCVIQNWLNIRRCIIPPSHIVWDREFSQHMFAIGNFFELKDSSIPVSFFGMFVKDKEIFKGKIEIASTVKHGKGKATFLGFDMRTINKDLFYTTLRSQTRLINYRKNKTSFGASVTVQGTDALTAGMKVEDELIVKKRLQLLFSGAAIAGRGGVAYGTSFQATLRDKHHPAGCSPASLELSLVNNHGGLTADLNFQSRIPIGWFTQLIADVKFNNKGTGKLSLCLHSSEARLHIAALIGLMIPLTRKLLGCPQELQFGQVGPR